MRRACRAQRRDMGKKKKKKLERRPAVNSNFLFRTRSERVVAFRVVAAAILPGELSKGFQATRISYYQNRERDPRREKPNSNILRNFKSTPSSS